MTVPHHNDDSAETRAARRAARIRGAILQPDATASSFDPAASTPAEPPPTAAGPGTLTAPPGYALVPTGDLQQLRADAGRATDLARDAAQAHQRKLVADAVADGRLFPRDAQAWTAALVATPNMEKVLAAMPKVHAFGGPELGHGQEAEYAEDDVDALWPKDREQRS